MDRCRAARRHGARCRPSHARSAAATARRAISRARRDRGCRANRRMPPSPALPALRPRRAARPSCEPTLAAAVMFGFAEAAPPAARYAEVELLHVLVIGKGLRLAF